MTFGTWLREKRTQRSPLLRQQDVADAIGLDRSYIVKVETGRIGLPQYETRQRIHAALGTTEAELIELGIVRAHVINVPTATAHAAAHPPTVIVSRTKAFFESLTEEQRQMLIETIREGEANARAADEREAGLRDRASGE